MPPKTFRLVHDQARQLAAQYCRDAEDGTICTFSEPLRSKDQNSVQWPYLDAFSKQLQWPVNGEMVFMSSEEWKDVFSAAFNQETVRLAMGLRGGVVMLGLRTSKMKKAVFSDWIEFLKAEAAHRKIIVYEDHRND